MFGRDVNTRGGVFGGGGYGGGVFSGMGGLSAYEQAAAGVRGLGATVWRGKTSDPAVAQAQAQLNQFLDKCGYKSIAVDGKVGPMTCGAAAFISSPHAEACDHSMVTSPVIGEIITSVCDGYTMPTKKGGAAPSSYSDDKWGESDAPKWGEFSDVVRVAQSGVNAELVSHGYFADAPTAGVLDAATCGDMKFVDQWGSTYSNMEGRNCKSFAFTARKKQVGSDIPVVVVDTPPGTQPPGTKPPGTQLPAKSGISTAWIVGGVLAAIAAVGAGVYFSQKG